MATSESYIPRVYAETLARSRNYRRSVFRGVLRRVVLISKISADFLTGAIAVVVAYALQRRIQGPFSLSIHRLVAVSLLHGVFTVLLLLRDGAYGDRVCLLRVGETERATRTSIQSLMLLSLANFLLRLGFPGIGLLMCLGLTTVLLIMQKQLVISSLHVFRRRGYDPKQVAFYRKSDKGKHVTSHPLYSPELGFSLIGVVREEAGGAGDWMLELESKHWQSGPIQAGPMAVDLLKALRYDHLTVAMPHAPGEMLPEVIGITDQAGAAVTFLPGSSTEDSQCSESLGDDGSVPAAPMELNDPWHYILAKRGMDIAVSCLLLVLLFPFLALIALLIRVTSPGPALFVQKRVGRNGEIFDMYKFRSMFTNSPIYDVSPTHSSDPRITGLGRVLRRTSVDELPQLMNVLLGNMSLVGPRPEMSFIVERYTPEQRQRLGLLPGITGLWQLSAGRAFPIHENIEYDLYYMVNRNFFMDVAILIHTVFFAARGGV